ncbi:MAG: hypothetical protein ACK5H2_04725 [Beutenbergiaceae bacterium]
MKRNLLMIPIAALALAGGLTACTTTSYSCSGNQCTVNLSGDGASTEIFDDSAEVSLLGIDGGVAEFAVNGQTATCEQGGSGQIGQFSITCTEVSEQKLSLTIVSG